MKSFVYRSWLKHELHARMLRWDEDKIEVNPEDVAYRNEVKDAVFLIMDAVDMVEQAITNITTRTREQLWQVYVSLQRKVDQILGSIKELRLPRVKTDILNNTDTGPAVGSSNREVRYRNVDSDCLNRIHRACDDCGQNEAERSNVCIGDALVDWWGRLAMEIPWGTWWTNTSWNCITFPWWY